ncbi:MAG: acylphosphatase [Parcubacteria group bacterium Gr01-1014_24]|nr:MAG: acylphosphatase [Parcubacteria group bacterium Gr01-1014_24]
MSKENLKHLTVKIYGRVQGINFRSSAREEAENLNIKGFVRNERDDSVLIEAEGTKENLEELLAWCKKGPLRAEVERVEIEEKDIVGYKNFEIQYS